jgi:hypothetical protein
MPRLMNANEPHAYRVKVTTTTIYKSGNETRINTEYIGPYADIGTAKAQLTRARRDANRYGTNYATSTVEGVVEVADMNWREI